MPHPFKALDHVQLAMPRGKEDAARAFYVGVLGMEELAKPAALAARGGAWFASGDVQLHLGVEDDFRPAKKAHPALQCQDYDALLQTLRSHNLKVIEDNELEPLRRSYIDDPFGNRIEILE